LNGFVIGENEKERKNVKKKNKSKRKSKFDLADPRSWEVGDNVRAIGRLDLIISLRLHSSHTFSNFIHLIEFLKSTPSGSQD